MCIRDRPKAVEQARKLVESDEVLLIFNSLGTPSNSAIHKYMNSKDVYKRQAKASMIITEESYETTEPTIDSHIVKLKATGADTFMSVTTPKFAAQAIKKLAEIEWKPLHIVVNVSASVGSVLKPAGFENSQGILSAAYAKDGADSQWDNDPGMKKFYAFLEKYYPEGLSLIHI